MKCTLNSDGPSTIIQDERFVVRHGLVKDDDWALQIKNLDKSDAGLYQCQTNSDPVQSQYYQLNVVGKFLLSLSWSSPSSTISMLTSYIVYLANKQLT